MSRLTLPHINMKTRKKVDFGAKRESPSPHITSVSVLWRLFSTLEVVQYIGGITSVLWGITSVLWRLFSTVGGSFSTVGDSFSTVEVVQYSEGITSVHVGG